jgi:hypothetical protein
MSRQQQQQQQQQEKQDQEHITTYVTTYNDNDDDIDRLKKSGSPENYGVTNSMQLILENHNDDDDDDDEDDLDRLEDSKLPTEDPNVTSYMKLMEDYGDQMELMTSEYKKREEQDKKDFCMQLKADLIDQSSESEEVKSRLSEFVSSSQFQQSKIAPQISDMNTLKVTYEAASAYSALCKYPLPAVWLVSFFLISIFFSTDTQNAACSLLVLNAILSIIQVFLPSLVLNFIPQEWFAERKLLKKLSYFCYADCSDPIFRCEGFRFVLRLYQTVLHLVLIQGSQANLDITHRFYLWFWPLQSVLLLTQTMDVEVNMIGYHSIMIAILRYELGFGPDVVFYASFMVIIVFCFHNWFRKLTNSSGLENIITLLLSQVVFNGLFYTVCFIASFIFWDKNRFLCLSVSLMNAILFGVLWPIFQQFIIGTPIICEVLFSSNHKSYNLNSFHRVQIILCFLGLIPAFYFPLWCFVHFFTVWFVSRGIAANCILMFKGVIKSKKN